MTTITIADGRQEIAELPQKDNTTAELPQKDNTFVWTFFMSALALMCIIFLLFAYVINTISIYNGTEKVAGRKEATDIYLMLLFFPGVFFLLIPSGAFTKERFDHIHNLSGQKTTAAGRVLSRGAILMTICLSLIGLYAISDLFSSFDERCTEDNKQGQEKEQQGILGKLGSKPVILVCDALESSVKGSRFVPFLISVVYFGLALATYYSLEQGGRESIDAFAARATRTGMRVAGQAGSKAASAAGTAGNYVGKRVATVMHAKAPPQLPPQLPPPSPPPMTPSKIKSMTPSKIKSPILAAQAVTRLIQQKAAAPTVLKTQTPPPPPRKINTEGEAARRIQTIVRAKKARNNLQQKLAAQKAAALSNTRVNYFKPPPGMRARKPSPGILQKMKKFQGPKTGPTRGNAKTGYRLV